MKRVIVAILLSTLIPLDWIALSGANIANAATVTNYTRPLHTVVTNDCPYSEPLAITSGNIHILLAITQDASGGFHVEAHGNVESGIVTGLVTGTQYRIEGSLSVNFEAPAGGSSTTIVSSFVLVAPGPDNNDVAIETMHITLSPDGTPIVQFDDLVIQCR